MINMMGLDNSDFSHMFGWGFGGIMMIGMILFWVAVIYAIVWFTRESVRGRRSDDQGQYSKTALDILKERYAKGEINKEEFEARKKDIGY